MTIGGPRPAPPIITDVVIIVIIIVWGTSMILQALITDYKPPLGINELALIVVGALFGLRPSKPNGGDKPAS